MCVTVHGHPVSLQEGAPVGEQVQPGVLIAPAGASGGVPVHTGLGRHFGSSFSDYLSPFWVSGGMRFPALCRGGNATERRGELRSQLSSRRRFRGDGREARVAGCRFLDVGERLGQPGVLLLVTPPCLRPYIEEATQGVP